MTTVKEFIEYLEGLPEETEVQVLVMQGGSYGGDYAEWEPLDITTNTDLIDLRDNQFSKGTSREGKVYLELGEK